MITKVVFGATKRLTAVADKINLLIKYFDSGRESFAADE
jgi:hypothetical protein